LMRASRTTFKEWPTRGLMNKKDKERSIDRVVAKLLEKNRVDANPTTVLDTGVFLLILLSIWEKAGKVEPQTVELVDEIVGAVFGLILVTRLSSHGWRDRLENEEANEEEKASAAKRLQALERLLRPEVYEVPADLIDKLASQNMNPHFSRAYELRKIMLELNSVLEPKRKGDEMGPACEVVIKPKVEAEPSSSSAYDWKKTRAFRWAKEQCETNSTLQSIAFKVYRDILKAEGFSTSNKEKNWENSCKRDLRKLQEWEAADPARSGLGWFSKDLKFSIRAFSTGWKFQKRGDEG
ncbi:MAG: hypothetical protein M3X11_17340, partial [Acidobacteriota bacterium]|nr:hypothetical protein [Acidobacteriota bacterium]